MNFFIRIYPKVGIVCGAASAIGTGSALSYNLQFGMEKIDVVDFALCAAVMTIYPGIPAGLLTGVTWPIAVPYLLSCIPEPKTPERKYYAPVPDRL